MDLDDLAMNLVPLQVSPLVVQPETSVPPAARVPHMVHPSIPTKRPPKLVLDEDHAWKTFKGIIFDREVSACYNMLVRDFEHSAIHDLSKVCSFLIISISFFYEI